MPWYIIININRLHFKDYFKANNFNKVSTKPFPSAPATPATGPPNQNPNTPVKINDIANLIVTVSPGVATQWSSPLGGNQMQQTGNIINSVLLPLEVQQRLQKGKQHYTYLNNAHSTPLFLISLLTLLETLWERCSASWMVLIKWSPGLAISSTSPNGTKRNKRCSSPDLQSLHPRHTIPIQSTIGIQEIQKDSHAVMTQTAHYTWYCKMLISIVSTTFNLSSSSRNNQPQQQQ